MRVTIEAAVDGEPLRIEIQICPNCSLSARGAQVFFAAACLVPLGVGGFLALKADPAVCGIRDGAARLGA
ncbi:MAG TPA: hypothetical protein VGD47_04945 [Steroidobacteraceae bacterium]